MARYPIFHAKKPCPKCGYTERLKRTRKCWTCEWNEADRYMRDYFANRSSRGKREHWSVDQRKIHDRALDIWLFFASDLRERQAYKESSHHRRATDGRFTKAQTDAILRSQAYRCAYCENSKNLHLDHMIPLARGGTNWPSNLQWLCAEYNLSKGARTDAEYRERIGLPPAKMLDHPFKAAMIWAILV